MTYPLFAGSLFGGIASSIASAVLSAVAHAMTSGITSLASWAIGGVAQAAVATTAVNLDSWFQGPWQAMLTVAALVAIPLFLVGVIESLAHGEGVAGLARVLGRLALAGVGSLIALGVVQLLLGLVDVACEVIEQGSGISIAAALARLGTALGVTAVVGGGAVAAIGALLLTLLAALAALVLWLELAMRTVLILVATAFLPLGLSGLLWPKTASWLRRLGEILTAIAISKLVIVVVLVLGAAALTSSAVSLTTPGADIDAMVNGVAFLGLATLGLPIALRVVPFAAEAALHMGRGSTLVRSGYTAARSAAGADSTSTLLRRTHGTGSSDQGDRGGPTPPEAGPNGKGPHGGGTGGSRPAGGDGPSGNQPGGSGQGGNGFSMPGSGKPGPQGNGPPGGTRPAGPSGSNVADDGARDPSPRSAHGNDSGSRPAQAATSPSGGQHGPRRANATPAPAAPSAPHTAPAPTAPRAPLPPAPIPSAQRPKPKGTP